MLLREYRFQNVYDWWPENSWNMWAREIMVTGVISITGKNPFLESFKAKNQQMPDTAFQSDDDDVESVWLCTEREEETFWWRSNYIHGPKRRE